MPAPAQQMPGGPGGQQLSLEDLQAMEQFVESERAKMSDDQRAQFDADVQQLTKEFEKMQQENPEQFATFIDQMLFGQPTEEAPMPVPAQQPEEAIISMPAQQPEEAPKVAANAEKQDAALKMINAIIKHTNSFLNKTAIMIEFPGKLKKWAEQGKIRGWRQGYTWESVKNAVGVKEQIEILLQKLNAIKEQDRATKTYKYLDALIANEALYTNIENLAINLKELEPQVEIDEFGIEPVSKEVREIMRTILGDYLDALFAQAIPQDIDAVIAGFEPKAKKYRDEEETSSKKALEESKKTRPAQGTIVGGYPEAEFNAPYSGGGMNPYDYFPYGGQSYGGQGDANRDNQQGKKDESKKSDEGAKKGDKAPEGKKEEPKDTNDDKKIKDSITQLEGSMSEAGLAIDSIIDRTPNNSPIQAESLATGIKGLKKSITSLNSLKIKLNKASTEGKRKRFREQIKEVYELHKDTLDGTSKISGPISGGAISPATKMAPQPTKKVAAISVQEIEGYKAQAEKVVNAEIEQYIKDETSKAIRDYSIKSVGEPAEVKEATEAGIVASIAEPYERNRDKMVKDKADEFIKEKKQRLEHEAEDSYRRAKDDWDAKANKGTSQEATASLSAADLTKAAEDIKNAFKAF